jgi:hypothetical protein
VYAPSPKLAMDTLADASGVPASVNTRPDIVPLCCAAATEATVANAAVTELIRFNNLSMVPPGLPLIGVT